MQKPFLVASEAHPYPAGNVADKGNRYISEHESRERFTGHCGSVRNVKPKKSN